MNFRLEYIGKSKWIVFNSYGEAWCGEEDEWVASTATQIMWTKDCFAQKMTWFEVKKFLKDCFDFEFPA
jgi:hypothetical protein